MKLHKGDMLPYGVTHILYVPLTDRCTSKSLLRSFLFAEPEERCGSGYRHPPASLLLHQVVGLLFHLRAVPDLRLPGCHECGQERGPEHAEGGLRRAPPCTRGLVRRDIEQQT